MNCMNKEPHHRYQLWLHSTSLSLNSHATKLPVQIQTPQGTIHWRQGEAAEGSWFAFVLGSDDLGDCIARASVHERICVCVYMCTMPQMDSETRRVTFLRPISTWCLNVTSTGPFFLEATQSQGLFLGLLESLRISNALKVQMISSKT